ncbi:spermidine/putrescine ABC transporter substrate-binding protein [Advenella sp. S44]|uniref:ABC transporter substrate-binding protein n=1 Tax=Advenella sp. S44 TaxID=1982755 RepID=UPI000C2AAF3D|nr:ABC transporter substrate-binding protein [Advenella sp. S44]PJX27739.1 spermidine/putrescine ABC transporter substrate-binding protein [Advenella sp. S44]
MKSTTIKGVVLRAAVATCLGLGAAGAHAADSLTLVSFGGDNKTAQEKAYYGPYEKETGIKITAAEYNGEQAKIKAMVDTSSVSWDAVEVESPELVRGCEEGLFEPIDWGGIGDKADFIEAATDKDCGVGMFVWSVALAYHGDKLKDNAPTSWADFWDVKKYPGKRGLRKGAKYTLEIALMADGVSPKDVYNVLATPEGVDRAFAKLDELKPHIQWWESGAQPAQYLVSGDVVMTSAYNGRISQAAREGTNLKVVWDQSVYDLDYWAIPKGSKNIAETMKFIAFASKPETQKVYAENIAYGVVNKKAIPLIDKKYLADMPTAPENEKNAIALDVDFWIDNGVSLEQRYNAWVAK